MTCVVCGCVYRRHRRLQSIIADQSGIATNIARQKSVVSAAYAITTSATPPHDSATNGSLAPISSTTCPTSSFLAPTSPINAICYCANRTYLFCQAQCGTTCTKNDGSLGPTSSTTRTTSSFFAPTSTTNRICLSCVSR